MAVQGQKGKKRFFYLLLFGSARITKYNVHKYTHQGGGADYDDDAPYALCAQHLFNPENY
jgi:hypothetical protein